MSDEQNRRWIIGPEGVHGGSNRAQLINCSIVREALTGDYLFYGPLSNLQPEATVKSPVELPFWFPKFRAALNGTVRRDWFIKVDYVDGGVEFDRAHGRWRNSQPPPHEDGDPTPTDTDTWTTQAGVGGGHTMDEKKDKKAAATASSK